MKRDTQKEFLAFLLTVKRDTGGANNQVSEKFLAFLLTVKREFLGFLVNSET